VNISTTSAARVAALLTATVLGGCASVSVQRNASETSAFADAEFGVATAVNATPASKVAAETRAREILASPLTAQGALELALRYSPSFQGLLAESAAASAAATQSGRLPNPIFEWERLAADHGVEIERALRISLLDVLLLPRRARLADLQQAQHRLRSAGDVVRTATEVRQAWVDAVAAVQSVKYAEQVQSAASAGADLARAMATSGNFSRLERARQQAFYADATAELARARLEAISARERLVRLLGLGPELAKSLTLPERLPDLPEAPDPDGAATQRAFEDRLDVSLARAELDYTAKSLGLTRVTSTVNLLEVGRLQNSTPEGETERGWAVEVAVPIFDFGDARRANAQSIYLASLNRAAQVIVEAHSHVRESSTAYRTAYDIAKHYRDEIVPLRRSIADENLLLYNGMLISVFELLADAREQVASVRQAIAAQRDFWSADAAFRAALIGQPVESIALGSPTLAPGAGTAAPH
jgi:outer membrane protein TolC